MVLGSRRPFGGACATLLAFGCGAPFSASSGDAPTGSGGAPAASAGQGGRSSGGTAESGAAGAALQPESGGEYASAAGANAGGAGMEPEPETCIVDPDHDGSCTGAIAAGSYATCAIREQGSVSCWGYNVNGRLGDGVAAHEPCSTGNGDCSRTPVGVVGVANARRLMGGENTFCILDDERHLSCWGWDLTNGTDIGLGTVKRFGTFEAPLASLRLPIGALDDEGRVWMGGYDDQGRGVFGDGPTTPGELRDFSVVPELIGVKHLDVGWYHACAVLPSGHVACWGRGLSGEIGDGELQDRPTPSVVDSITNVSSVAVGDALSCALLQGGAVACWGGNDRGQLGNGAESASPEPVAVSGLVDAVEIDAGFGHACARLASGRIVCWGNDRHGQLGDADDHPNCSLAFPEPCSRTPVEVAGLNDAVALSVGSQHSCALRSSGDVVCWGSNTFGQLGDGSFADAHTPVTVAEL